VKGYSNEWSYLTSTNDSRWSSSQQSLMDGIDTTMKECCKIISRKLVSRRPLWCCGGGSDSSQRVQCTTQHMPSTLWHQLLMIQSVSWYSTVSQSVGLLYLYLMFSVLYISGYRCCCFWTCQAVRVHVYRHHGVFTSYFTLTLYSQAHLHIYNQYTVFI